MLNAGNRKGNGHIRGCGQGTAVPRQGSAAQIIGPETPAATPVAQRDSRFVGSVRARAARGLAVLIPFTTCCASNERRVARGMRNRRTGQSAGFQYLHLGTFPDPGGSLEAPLQLWIASRTPPDRRPALRRRRFTC